jgi:hypothetical protein
MTSPEETPPAPSERPSDGPGKALPLQLELPGAIGRPEAGDDNDAATERARGSHPRRRTIAKGLAWTVAIAGGLAGVTAWWLPVLLRDECIEVAKEHGIDLAVERVRIVPAGLQLFGVRAVSPLLPEAVAASPEVDVETGAFRPRIVTFRKGSVAYHGPPGDLAAAIAKWRASPSGGEAGTWSPMSIVFDGTDVDWHSPGAGALHVGASDVHATFAWTSAAADGPADGVVPQARVRSEHVSMDLPDGDRLGPWSVDVERTRHASRTRVAFDPDVPDSSFLLIVGDGDSITAADLVVPRSPVARLGVRGPSFAGLSPETQIESSIHYATMGPTRADLSARGLLQGLRLPGLADAIDVAWEGAARGDPTSGIDVKNAHLVVGPVQGALRGTWKMIGDGVRVTLAWIADARCTDDAKGGGGNASIAFDSRDLSATRLDFSLPSVRKGCSPLRGSAARGE